MSGGGSANRSANRNASAPWIGQQPFLTDVFSQAQGAYNQGVPGYYPGATYTPFNDIQQGAMGATMGRAGGSPQEWQMGQFLSNAMMQPQFDLSGGGMGANYAIGGLPFAMQGLAGAGGPSLFGGQRFAQSGYNPFAAGGIGAQHYIGNQLGSDPTLGGRIGDISGQVDTGVDPTARNTLEATARGDMLNANPYLDATFARASQNVRDRFGETVLPGINATFGSAGRTGSGIHQASVGQAGEDLADALGNMATDIYGGNWQNERGLMNQAAGQLGQLGMQSGNLGLGVAGLGADVYSGDAARQLSAAGLGQSGAQFGETNALAQNRLGADLYNQGANRRLDAMRSLQEGGFQGMGALNDFYNSIGANQMGAAGMVPDLSMMQWGNIDRMRGVGDDVQGLANQALQDDMNRFNYYNQAPWDLLQNYANIIMAQQLGQSRGSGSSWGMTGYGGAPGGGAGGAGGE